LVALASCLALLSGVAVGHARPADGVDSVSVADQQIIKEVRDHSELMQNLEYLSDQIGPRLTGSAQLKQANDWTADLFRKYGLTNVHLEPWTIAHSWTRGTASARIISPAEHPLTIAAAGWSPSTLGTVRGPVVYVDAKTREELDKFHGQLKGAIVIVQEPDSLSPPKPTDPNAVRPLQEPPPFPGQPAAPSPMAAMAEFARIRTTFFQQEGVAVVLRDSAKPHALLNMTGIGGEKFEIGAVPTAFITGEGYRMIFRMLKHGPVQLEVAMSNSFSEKPVEVYNTVAEIPGSEKPDEVVMLGAHLDSWDLGTGSTDNGTGSMAVMEAARALMKSGVRPKRTIRFVLFTGEEEGLCGSVKYVEAHKADLDKISGILVHDTGTGRVISIALHDNYQDRQIVDQVIAPLHELKLLEPSMVHMSGTDHKSFDDAGVPGFWTMQEGAEYRLTHHSQSDTFDKVWPDDINQGAQVLATWAYNTAQLPAMLPRRPVPPPADASAAPAAPKPDPIAEMDAKILAQVKSDEPELKANLEYLADHIGPRLTGSPQLERASHWTAERFKEAGLANAHLESWQIANAWTRGPASARVTSPVEQTLTVATAGWAPGTQGLLHGPVIGLDPKSEEELRQYAGKLAGAVVLFGKPVEMVAPGNPLFVPWGDETIPVALPKSDQPIDYSAYSKARRAQLKFLEKEHVGAIVLGSEKWYGLMNMSVSSTTYQPSGAPIAYMARENYTLLWRLLESGPVEVDMNLGASFSAQNVNVYNTVAEIRGSEKPDQLVIIGGHLDSWDLGTGATDNGTGAMAVLEAARALQKLGVKPARTIRFVLFTGEEQGLNGSKAYVAAHQDEMSKISGVLVDDSGTGKVLTIGLMANYGVRETIDHALYPLAKGVGFAEPTLRTEGGSDHVSFDQAGVPAFWCVQDGVDYDKTHHSQADTIDRVRWDDLTEGAQVLAVFAYNVAQLPEMLPRKPAPPASAEK
jgi:Zn-dependent M28 family amino/carboxypeptidase